MKVATQPPIHTSLGFETTQIHKSWRTKTFIKPLPSCLSTSVSFNHDCREKEKVELRQLKVQKSGNCALSIVINCPGVASECVWDGDDLKFVPHKGISSFFWWDISDSEEGLRKLGAVCLSGLKNFFFPRVASCNYLEYVKWKFLHRVFSSALQVLATQAMFRAIGIGYSRSLPSAAALKWVLKDGLGRLSRCMYTAALASAFDTKLKRVRFSTSILFSLSIGLELVTPVFPKYFLLLAAIANVAKQISHACYTATSSAINRSFAVADNLCEVSAKAQIQSVCFDNLGLVLAATLNFSFRSNQRFLEALPFVLYPFFSALDLYGIYQGLKHVHLRTLSKGRLESIMNIWIEQEYVASPAEVSKREEIIHLWDKGADALPIRIGCLNPKRKMPKPPLRTLKSLKQEDFFFICIEVLNDRLKKHGILLSLREGATTENILKGLLQACYIRKWLLEEKICWEEELSGEKWPALVKESKRFAEDGFRPLLEKMQELGWSCGNILLSREELAGYVLVPPSWV